MNRRQFTGYLVAGAAGAATLELEGCSVLSELETWVPIGLTAFDTLVSYLNPVAGSALAVAVGVADALWQVVATAIANYQHTTDPTTTLLQKVVAALDALSGGLTTIESALPAGIPAAILKAVNFGFSLLLATLKSISNSITPASPTPTLALKSTSVKGVANATSAKDFIKQFNQNVCVAAGYKPRMK